MVVICTGGSGTVRSGRQHWPMGPGQALLLPPHCPHDFEADSGGWSYTILNYHSESLIRQNIRLPRLISIHAQPLEAMILAFRREYQSDRDPVLLRQMLDIIQTKILRLFNPAQSSGRLWPVWSAVLEHPEFNWTVEALTQRAHLSGEHLRRICQQDLGRSPMEQVTWLRLKVAASRLSIGDEVIEDIAHDVGFESERAFRSAFAKRFQCSPTQYRQRNRLILEELNNSQTTDRATSSPASQDTASSQSNYDPIDGAKAPVHLALQSAANARFSVGNHPWFGDIPLYLPQAGLTSIHGVPFLILNEQKGPSFVLMRSQNLEKDARGKKLPIRVQLPVKRLVRAAYFLHACGWGAQFGPFATYRLVYSDKSVAEQPVVVLAGTHPEEADGCKANIQDWFFSWEQLRRPHVKPYDATPTSAPARESQYLYTLEWINPHPEKKVNFLEIESDPKRAATLAVLAISLV
jgi:AraC-like DNA-binding protein